MPTWSCTARRSGDRLSRSRCCARTIRHVTYVHITQILKLTGWLFGAHWRGRET
jgi:hypothetical protein